MDNNFGLGDDRDEFDNKETKEDFPLESKKPWYLTPSVTVEKGYNPYRDEKSVFEETANRCVGAFKGANQLDGESPEEFYYRRRWEWGCKGYYFKI